MTKLAANLTMMFTDLPFLDRFVAAADAGFEGVEFLFPYEESPDRIAAVLARHHLQVVLFNFPAGNWAAGERGIAALPDRVGEVRSGVARALEYARALGCFKLHLMAGKVPSGATRSTYEQTLENNVAFVADAVAPEGIEVLLEAINTRVDVPGYFLDRTEMVAALIERLNRPNVRMQFDIYHVQVMQGDLARRLKSLLPQIGHIQLADNPGRGEPGTGEINYQWLLRHIDQLGYEGWIGCEYVPKAETRDRLEWARPYLSTSKAEPR